ncbi:WbuC family cupin fold metalloprotein [Photobacterium leiognathi]|uniref:WbuC family cupin fold metalloprotein n=1 Tax=Photobacterium leiognathi TaxID=553611 RepID=UPI0027398276|nr:WbuC family cupin fold metalloprotein [Photobacterium leiognathi]
MKTIDQEIINNLYIAADTSDRKRAHYLLHTSHQDKVQRLLIAMKQGSYVEPHYHELPHQWELFQVLDGLVKVTLYSDDGVIRETFNIGGNSSIKLIELQPNEIHSVECLSEQALLLEVKEGPFNAEFAKSFIKVN